MWELGWIDHTHTYTRRSLSARNEHWWAANAFLHVLFWESTDRKLCLTARLKVKTWMKWPTLCMATQNGWFKRKRGHICRSIGSPILAPASGFFCLLCIKSANQYMYRQDSNTSWVRQSFSCHPWAMQCCGRVAVLHPLVLAWDWVMVRDGSSQKELSVILDFTIYGFAMVCPNQGIPVHPKTHRGPIVHHCWSSGEKW